MTKSINKLNPNTRVLGVQAKSFGRGALGKFSRLSVLAVAAAMFLPHTVIADDIFTHNPPVKKKERSENEFFGMALTLDVPKATLVSLQMDKAPIVLPIPRSVSNGSAALTSSRLNKTLSRATYKAGKPRRPSVAPTELRPAVTPETNTQLAWHANAVAVNVVPHKPRIVIVIDDLGLRKQQTQETIDLDAPLTLAFLPYAHDVAGQAKRAREAGHELMVHVPMEPIGTENPGPNALKTDLAQEEVQRRLEWALSQFDGFVGANNHMGSKFTQDVPGLDTVMKTMSAKGLLFLDSVTGPSRAARSAKAAQVPYLKRDVFIDHFINEASVKKYLKQLEFTALKQGFAIGIGHPHDVTLSVLRTWLFDVQARGFQIVPISAIMMEQEDKLLQAQNEQSKPKVQKVAQTTTNRADF